MAGEAQEEILPFIKLKQLLALCEKQPLGCAFGLTKDKKECLLLIDKLARPKKVATLLKAAGKTALDPQTLRFGHVTVDVENDPGTLRFTVNRLEAGGTIITLNKLAKRAAYSAIVINVNESLENEAEVEGAPPAVPEAPPVQPVADPAALKARLAELVKQMIAHSQQDPAIHERMTKLAKTANIQLSTNNFATAVELMDGLERMLLAPPPGNEELDKIHRARLGLAPALVAAAAASATLAGKIAGEDVALEAALQAGDAAVARERLFELVTLSKQGGAAPQPGGDKSGVRVAEALIKWNRARAYVGQQITKLQREIVAQTQDEDDAAEIAGNMGVFDRLMDFLDDSLGAKLSEIRAAGDTAAKTALSKEAKSIVAGFQQFVASDSLMNVIDDNGFMLLDIKPTVTAALADVMASI